MGFLSFSSRLLSSARFLFSKWSAPLRRARSALLGLTSPGPTFLFLSHSTLQPINLTGDRNNPSLIDVTSHHSFMVLRLGTGESSLCFRFCFPRLVTISGVHRLISSSSNGQMPVDPPPSTPAVELAFHAASTSSGFQPAHEKFISRLQAD